MLEHEPRAAGRTERFFSIAFCAVLLALVAVASPFRLHVFGVVPHFLETYVAVLGTTELLTALLLLWRARSATDERLATLAACYAFSAPLIVANVLTLPGIAAPRGAFPFQTPPWLWVLWHIGWALGIVVFAVSPGRTTTRPEIRWLIGLGGAAVAIVVALRLPDLPPLLRPDGSFAPALYASDGVALALSAVAIGALVRRWAALTTLDLWVGVATLALALDVAFMLAAPIRFSLGTYVARGLGMLSSIVVLVALTNDLARLIRRADVLDQYAILAEHLPQIALIVDPERRCSFVNRAWTDLTGQTPAEALGDGYRSAVHPDDLTASAALPIAAGAREIRLRDGRDGAYRRHLVRAVPIGGPVTRAAGFVVTAIDVEDQRRDAHRLAEVYAREHAVAQRLQEAFLPAFLPSSDAFVFDAVYRPASSDAGVGGDWYDAFTLRDGRIGISIGDAAGHGLDAATMMVRLRETLRAVAEVERGRPDRVLTFGNAAALLAGADFATALFAVYDPATLRFTYACAGHPAPVLRRGREARVLDGGGVPLGVSRSAAFTVCNVPIEAGDQIVFYTDGVLENERDPVEGERRLVEAVTDGFEHAHALADKLLVSGQPDDVAILVLTVASGAVAVRDTPTWRFVSDDASSAQSARPSFVAYLRQRGVPPPAVADAELVFGELVGNVVRHAPGAIDVEVQWSGVTPILYVAGCS